MGQVLFAALFQEGVQGLVVDIFQRRDPLLPEKMKKDINIRLIGLNGIVCKAPFCDQVAEK